MKTAKEVCKELGIRYYKLDYMIRNGLVPEPRVLANNHRVFTNEDIKRIREAIGVGSK
jgi:DNA-binding transcriptional MerR regulator